MGESCFAHGNHVDLRNSLFFYWRDKLIWRKNPVVRIEIVPPKNTIMLQHLKIQSSLHDLPIGHFPKKKHFKLLALKGVAVAYERWRGERWKLVKLELYINIGSSYIGEKRFKPKRILGVFWGILRLRLRGSFQDFRRVPLSLLYGSPSRSINK